MIQPIGHPLTAIATGLSPMAADRPEVPPQPPLAAARETLAADTSTTGGETRQTGRDTTLPSQQTPLEKALQLVNNSLEAWSTGMRFEMDEDAQRLVVSIIDSATGEVLRTVPSDAVLRVAKMIVQLQGTSVDTRA